MKGAEPLLAAKEMARLPDLRPARALTDVTYKAQVGGFSGAKFSNEMVLFYNHIDELMPDKTYPIRECSIKMPVKVLPVISGGKAIYDMGDYRIEWEMTKKDSVKLTMYVVTKKAQVAIPISTHYDIDFDGSNLYVLVDGDIWLEFQAPTKCVDKDGKPIDVRYDYDYDNRTLNLVIEDIDASRYPITIDPTVVDNDGQGGQPVGMGNVVARDSSGNIYVVWHEDNGTNSIIYLSKYNSSLVIQKNHVVLVAVAASSPKIETVASGVRCIYPSIRIVGTKLHIIYWYDFGMAIGNRHWHYSKCINLTNCDVAANWVIGNETVQGAENPCGTNIIYGGGLAVATDGSMYLVQGMTDGTYKLQGTSHPGTGAGSWAAATNIDGTGNYPHEPRIDFDDDERLHLSYCTNKAGGSQYHQRYLKATNVKNVTAWGASVVVIDNGAMAWMGAGGIIAKGNKIVVTNSFRTVNTYYMNYSSDNGATWTYGTGNPSGTAVSLLNTVAGTSDISGHTLTRDGSGLWYFVYQKRADADWYWKSFNGAALSGETSIATQVAFQNRNIAIEHDVPSDATVAYVLYCDEDASPDVLYLDSIAVTPASTGPTPQHKPWIW